MPKHLVSLGKTKKQKRLLAVNSCHLYYTQYIIHDNHPNNQTLKKLAFLIILYE